jgi:hypothetical protein
VAEGQQPPRVHSSGLVALTVALLDPSTPQASARGEVIRSRRGLRSIAIGRRNQVMPDFRLVTRRTDHCLRSLHVLIALRGGRLRRRPCRLARPRTPNFQSRGAAPSVRGLPVHAPYARRPALERSAPSRGSVASRSASTSWTRSGDGPRRAGGLAPAQGRSDLHHLAGGRQRPAQP